MDAGGRVDAAMPILADVERNEQVAAEFYLYRRVAMDSGGAGQFRGGRSAEVALTLHGIEQADALIMTPGAEVPNTVGALGGVPGGTGPQSSGWEGIRKGKGKPRRWGKIRPKHRRQDYTTT